MQTTTTATSTQSPSESTEATGARRSHPLRTALVALLLAAGSFAGLGAVGAAPASAATSTTACFRYAAGGVYANKPVYLTQVDRYGRYIKSLRKGSTNSRGCGTFTSTPSGVYLRMEAYVVLGDANVGLGIFDGVTPYISNPGAGLANLGTGYVYEIKCVPGLYTTWC